MDTVKWTELEAEYRSKSGSNKPEDVVRCRQLTRELERLTTAFLEDHDGPRVRRSSGADRQR